MANRRLHTVDREVGYSVHEIMTPIDELMRWTGDEEERAKLLRTDYTYFPVEQNGVITGLIHRDDLERQNPHQSLTAEWLIAADTSILHLLELFAKQEHRGRVFLVLKSSQIVGLVAPADLNQVQARASVYLLVANFEAALADLIRRELPDEERYKRHILKKHLKEAQKRQDQNKEDDIDLDILCYLYLDDLTAIVAGEEQLRRLFGLPDDDTAKDKLNFRIVRNPVSHPTSVFIASRNDIAEANDACERLIKFGQKIRAELEA